MSKPLGSIELYTRNKITKEGTNGVDSTDFLQWCNY